MMNIVVVSFDYFFFSSSGRVVEKLTIDTWSFTS